MTDNDVLKAILVEIREMRKLLEKRVEVSGEPVTFPIPTPPEFPRPYNPGSIPEYTLPQRCSRCGIELSQVMSYSCQDPRCPTGLGPITC